jgi:hypothetical protein
MILLVSPNSAEIEPNVSPVDIRSMVYMPSRRSYQTAERLGHVALDATPIFGVEPSRRCSRHRFALAWA